MRTIRRVTVVLLMALVAAACGGSDNDSDTGAGQTSQTTVAAAQIDPSKELKVGFTVDQYLVEGPDANLGAYPLNTNVAETLIYMNEKYELEPRLAERWEFRPPNTWRFFIRKGVKFHDGQPLNAEAVKGMFVRLSKRAGGSTVKAGPDSAVVVDDYTIDFTPTEPNLRVPEQIVHPQNAVLAPGTDFTKNPVGTGPYKFVSYRQKENIVVERNNDYWGPKAQAAKITIRFYPDSNARTLALQAGDIDIAYNVPRDDVGTLKSKGFTIANSTAGAYRAMYANIHGSAPYDILQDINVRKAVEMGIDRSKYVSGVLNGLATTDQTWVPPAVLGSSASLVKGYTYDLNAAKTLLDYAGWKVGSSGIREKAGRPLKLTLVSGFPSAEILRPSPTYVQAELKNLGIDVSIDERPDAASFQDLITKKQGDLFMEEGNQNDANVGFLPVLLLYTGPGSSGGTYQGIEAPGATFDGILAPALTEPDHAKLQAIVAKAMDEAITNQAVIVPLAGVFRTYGLKSTVQGFIPHPSFLNVNWIPVGLSK
jgi:peptide/nickel transport system substrate-binding protein